MMKINEAEERKLGDKEDRRRERPTSHTEQESAEKHKRF